MSSERIIIDGDTAVAGSVFSFMVYCNKNTLLPLTANFLNVWFRLPPRPRPKSVPPRVLPKKR